MQSLTGEQAAAGQQELAGKAALIASVGGQRGWADWTDPTTGYGGCCRSSSGWPG